MLKSSSSRTVYATQYFYGFKMIRKFSLLLIFVAVNLTAAAADFASTETWQWSVPGPNGQLEKTIVRFDAAENGTITGIVIDRSGVHPITNATLKNDKLEFTVVRETPSGKSETSYSLKFDAKNPKLTIERPDLAPAAKKAGKTRKTEIDVTRVSSSPALPIPAPKN